MSTYLDRFFDAYVECALWATPYTAETGNMENGNLDDICGPEDIAPETLAEMRADCEEFLRMTGMEHRHNWTAEQAGHDFWLTRNGHGAGFWDRGEPDGDILAEHAKAFRGVDLYVGDDGMVYAS